MLIQCVIRSFEFRHTLTHALVHINTHTHGSLTRRSPSRDFDTQRERNATDTASAPTLSELQPQQKKETLAEEVGGASSRPGNIKVGNRKRNQRLRERLKKPSG